MTNKKNNTAKVYKLLLQKLWCNACCLRPIPAVAALHQGAPGQMTWLEDPPPWLHPAYCFGNGVNRK